MVAKYVGSLILLCIIFYDSFIHIRPQRALVILIIPLSLPFLGLNNKLSVRMGSGAYPSATSKKYKHKSR